MKTRSWIRKLFARPVAHPLRKRPHRARPAVEALEQRTVPSFTVTNTLDDGSVGSLRWAVGEANMTGGDETIDFDPIVFATPQTITLAGTQLVLTDTTGTETITGPAAGVTVDGGGVSRVFAIGGIGGGVTASMSGLTISGGHTIDGSGGILNFGTLSLTNCTVSGNTSGFYSGGGGGIQNLGTLSLTNCTVSGNTAVGYGAGGGILNGGTLSLTNCTVSGNHSTGYGDGGGIENTGTLSLTDCTISGNSARSGGGLARSGGTVTLTDCTVSGNSATNEGGGVYNLSGGTLMLNNSTVSGNSAFRGGGIYTLGSLPTLSNTIVAGNTFGGNPSDIFGNVDANSSYNVIGTGGSGGLIDGVNHNQVGLANPGLGALSDHGGPTQTIDLLGGSPALNAGDPAQLGLPDQRGVVRTGGVNIGAYQASASAFLVSAPETVQSGAPFDVTLTAVDPFNQMAVGYTGTVTFSTSDSDPGVVLPADYAFVLADGGMHTFTDTGPGEVTLVTPGDQMLTVMDTADNTITGSIVITVSGGPAPHGQGPPPSTAPARLARGEARTPSQPSASQVVGRERWFASFHDGDYVWLTVARLRHQARGETAWGMADLFGGDDLLFA